MTVVSIEPMENGYRISALGVGVSTHAAASDIPKALAWAGHFLERYAKKSN